MGNGPERVTGFVTLGEVERCPERYPWSVDAGTPGAVNVLADDPPRATFSSGDKKLAESELCDEKKVGRGWTICAVWSAGLWDISAAIIGSA